MYYRVKHLIIIFQIKLVWTLIVGDGRDRFCLEIYPQYSRFVKATFTKLNSLSGDSESESISQFFHILGSVEQQKGLCDVGDGKYEYTIYSSCCNVDKGIYYYRTYEDSQITAIDMNKEDLDSQELISYPIMKNNKLNI